MAAGWPCKFEQWGPMDRGFRRLTALGHNKKCFVLKVTT